MEQFITPPNHVNFIAKNLFGEIGQIINGSIAFVDLNGGGPTSKHTHEHNHLFIVTEGEARVEFENETIIIHKNEAYLVQGSRLHSVWNNSDGKTVMIGISVKKKSSRAMKRFNFNTIGLLTRDNRAIVDFYTKVFGFTTSLLRPTTEPWGQRTCYVADPDGNLIEISSFIA